MPNRSATNALLEAVQQYLQQELVFPAIVQHCMTPYMNREMFARNSIYIALPLLFADALGNKTSQHKLVPIAAAGFMHFVSVLKIDDAFDNPEKQVDKLNMLLTITMQQQVQRILTRVHPKNTWFWQQWNRRHDIYYNQVNTPSTVKELNHTAFSQYCRITANRSILGLVALDAVFNNQKNTAAQHQALESIYNNFVTAYQLQDDLKDIHEDLATGQLNYVRLLMAPQLGYPERPDKEELVKQLYISGRYKKIYTTAARLLNNAITTATHLRAGLWVAALKTFAEQLQHDYYNLHGFVRAVNKRAALAGAGKTIEAPALPRLNLPSKQLAPVTRRLLRYLVQQKQNGFGELKHVMFLNKVIGLNTRNDIQVNDTFQRALVADIFCDCMHLNRDYFLRLSLSELSYLKRKRQKDEIGGWSYYPGIPEVAADADDLGQMLQVFVRTGNTATIPAFFEKPIAVLLEHRRNNDGGIETWIIPRHTRHEAYQRQEHFNQIWGTGPDVEVMANFLYGLCLYNYPRFRNEIVAGCNYLLTQQTENNLWEPKWYYGPYYGTYTVLRLFRAVSVQEPHFRERYKKTIAPATFATLLAMQKEDGSWGLNGQGDYLSTSLAALSLCCVNGNSGNPVQFKKKAAMAAAYLAACPEDAGYSAFNTPFIRPRVKDPYSSKTITTGYMVKALLGLAPLTS
ncbi:MAG: class 1 isoprenoid biosynthesis enzyme [Dinghuibacter sp.]|nr:class 1 isoprenoid biosynthesis enzyme [Dinghuibacter sp.]